MMSWYLFGLLGASAFVIFVSLNLNWRYWFYIQQQAKKIDELSYENYKLKGGTQ